MKIRRTIYLVIACIFTGLNLLMYFIVLMHPNEQIGVDPADKGDAAIQFGHYIGLNLFTIVGIIFYYAAYRVQKKIKRKEMKEMLESF